VGIYQSLVFAQTKGDITLYQLCNELISRHDNLRRSLELRISVDSKIDLSTDKIIIEYLLRVKEGTLYFLAAEICSRFNSDPKSMNGSKKCIRKLTRSLGSRGNTQYDKLLDKFLKTNEETLSYIKVQRDDYLVHSDKVDWSMFPNISIDEYTTVLDGIADILDLIMVKEFHPVRKTYRGGMTLGIDIAILT
jgi:hypothetical protein